MKATALRNFHLPLPPDLQGRLKTAADREGVPATVLARQALDDGLRFRERTALAQEIALYAEATKGSDADLDPGLEQAALAAFPDAHGSEP